ncbi:MAG: site-specific DNA-methyltransferase [Bacilli bacterium]|nr:site-specific DNA-methyltransferase [Bacilli bacterium]
MLYNDDCINVFKKITDNSIDMIFADPPYFLSNNGLSIHNGKIVSVNKGEWDKKENYEDVKLFNETWLKECYRVLKDGSSLWVSGTQHNIFDIREIILKLGFKIQNIIIWHKIDPPPLIFKTRFKFSYEFIIWATKGKNNSFNYEEVFKINNEEMHDVWNIGAVKKDEKLFGYHPTQKPEKLLEIIIKSTSKVNDIILDPFMGSGTTCYVAKKLNRRYIGIEKNEEYFIISKSRITNIKITHIN